MVHLSKHIGLALLIAASGVACGGGSEFTQGTEGVAGVGGQSAAGGAIGGPGGVGASAGAGGTGLTGGAGGAGAGGSGAGGSGAGGTGAGGSGTGGAGAGGSGAGGAGAGGGGGGSGAQTGDGPRSFFVGDSRVDGQPEWFELQHDTETVLLKSLVHPASSGRIDGIAYSKALDAVAIARSDSNGQPAIELYAQTGGEGMRLFSAPSTFTDFRSLAFSADGNWLAYVADIDSDGEYAIYAQRTTEPAFPKRLSANTGDPARIVTFLQWSRSDETGAAYLAYTGDLNVDDHYNGYIVNVAEQFPQAVPVALPSELGSGSNVQGMLDWDAYDRLYFKSTLSGNFEHRLYRIDIDGSGRELVPNTMFPGGSGNGHIGSFGISPDGKTIAFSADVRLTKFYDVHVMRLDISQDPIRLTTLPPAIHDGNASGPDFGNKLTWSPDGKWLAFRADWVVGTASQNQVFSPFVLRTVAGQSATRIVSTPVFGETDWIEFSRDSARIVMRGDLVEGARHELYVTEDFASADQDPETLRVQTPVFGGDVFRAVTDR